MADKTPQDDTFTQVNSGQAEYWNSDVGLKWARNQQRLDLLMSEVRDRLLREMAPARGERVLDVGCGTGDTTLAAAAAVGPVGRVTGADISEPMLAIARHRAAEVPQAAFVLADVQTYRFAPASFDAIQSRFGVMFFSDNHAAFSNLASALRPRGRLHFAAWAAPADNPWLTASRSAAVDRLGPTPPEPPDAPGPFAFADAAMVLDILGRAGFRDPSVVTASIRLHVAGTSEEVAEFALQIGPATRILMEKNGTADDRAAIAETLAARFAPYARDGVISFPASVHFFSATTP